MDRLCRIYTNGQPEDVMKLTQALLPLPNEAIRDKMDSYLMSKMVKFRNKLEPKAQELRKRNLKK